MGWLVVLITFCYTTITYSNFLCWKRIKLNKTLDYGDLRLSHESPKMSVGIVFFENLSADIVIETVGRNPHISSHHYSLYLQTGVDENEDDNISDESFGLVFLKTIGTWREEGVLSFFSYFTSFFIYSPAAEGEKIPFVVVSLF